MSSGHQRSCFIPFPAHLRCAPMYRVTEKSVSCGHPLSYSSTYPTHSFLIPPTLLISPTFLIPLTLLIPPAFLISPTFLIPLTLLIPPAFLISPTPHHTSCTPHHTYTSYLHLLTTLPHLTISILPIILLPYLYTPSYIHHSSLLYCDCNNTSG